MAENNRMILKWIGSHSKQQHEDIRLLFYRNLKLLIWGNNYSH